MIHLEVGEGTADCTTIVTHNVRNFDKAQRFRINTMTPYEYLKRIGEIR